MNKLQKIAEKYSKIDFNQENYEVGGGLDSCKFASRRHEDACNDAGKLTLGKANSLFSKATGLATAEINELIKFCFHDLEWHHAGKLPKQYGGGMKKTYFINSIQIVEFATNFEKIQVSFAEKQKMAVDYEAYQKNLEARKIEYLQARATKVVRTSYLAFKEPYYIEICREMNGKYGWFNAQYQYNLPTYITAWVFSSEDEYREYLNIV